MIRKANVGDVKQIQKLVNMYANENKMLSRSLNNIFETIRDFYVYIEADKLIGCCALHVVWEDLAEVKALAVAREFSGKGIGKMLVNSCIEESKTLGIKNVFSLTYIKDFFVKLGFKEITREELPHKVWSECIHCPKFPDCDEIAVLKKL
ncbi:N-acetyltransferase [bacterium]